MLLVGNLTKRCCGRCSLRQPCREVSTADPTAERRSIMVLAVRLEPPPQDRHNYGKPWLKRTNFNRRVVPKYFDARMTKAGVTKTEADFAKVLEAFVAFSKTPIDCTHEMLMFAANDSHRLKWWTGPHQFKVILERGFYESTKMIRHGSHCRRCTLVICEFTASRQVDLSWDLGGPGKCILRAEEFNDFFDRDSQIRGAVNFPVQSSAE